MKKITFALPALFALAFCLSPALAFAQDVPGISAADSADTYFSPSGNPEVWAEKPAGYFTPEEWAAAHPPPPVSLDDAKAEKKADIDANTVRIRDRDGLSYGGERFAMTDGARLNWTGMLAASAMLPLPMNILTIDDKPFALVDRNALMSFLMAVMAYDTAEGSPVTAGRALRMRVEAATTVEEVEAIADDRE